MSAHRHLLRHGPPPAVLPAAWALLLSLLATQPAQAEPAPGRYAAQMCVTVATRAADCGPAEAELRPSRQLAVRLSDIVYLLTLRTGHVDVVLMHGPMQIDGFSAPFEWKGNELQFVDAQKQVRFAVRLGARQAAPG